MRLHKSEFDVTRCTKAELSGAERGKPRDPSSPLSSYLRAEPAYDLRELASVRAIYRLTVLDHLPLRYSLCLADLIT